MTTGNEVDTAGDDDRAQPASSNANADARHTPSIGDLARMGSKFVSRPPTWSLGDGPDPGF
ncbi:MAG: hypothetical protein LC739_05985 [Actinobacteria bacterium]|nr:hypothetical protein [Actinomycetota bacterium]